MLAKKEGIRNKNADMSEYELWTRWAVMRAKKATGFVGWLGTRLSIKRALATGKGME